MSYQTQEQAAAAATHQLGEVGDEVYLHEASCRCYDGGPMCEPTVIVLTEEGWRYRPPPFLNLAALEAIGVPTDKIFGND